MMKISYGNIEGVIRKFSDNREQAAYRNACFTLMCGGWRGSWHCCGIRGERANVIWNEAEKAVKDNK